MGILLWKNYLPIFDSNDIELHLITLANEQMQLNQDEIELDSLHVMTEAYSSGGHARLAMKLAGMHEEPPDLLVVNSIESRDLEKELKKVFKNISNPIFESARNKVEKIHQICSRYKKIFLHIHPDDIFTVVACGCLSKKWNGVVHFINHSDHTFSYGATISDIYFQISYFGIQRDFHKNIKGVQSFLGIPLDIPDSIPLKSTAKQPQFLTGGSPWKYNFIKDGRFNKLLKSLRERYSGSIFIGIGTKIKGLKNFQIESHFKYKQILKKASYYIDSYPVPGGSAFTEAFYEGALCIGLSSPIQGYSPLEKIKRLSLDEQLSLKIGDPYYLQLWSDCIEVHGLENVKKRYLNAINEGKYSQFPMHLDYGNNADIHYFEKERITLLSYKSFEILLKHKVISIEMALLYDLFRVFLIWLLQKTKKMIAKWLHRIFKLI